MIRSSSTKKLVLTANISDMIRDQVITDFIIKECDDEICPRKSRCGYFYVCCGNLRDSNDNGFCGHSFMELGD